MYVGQGNKATASEILVCQSYFEHFPNARGLTAWVTVCFIMVKVGKYVNFCYGAEDYPWCYKNTNVAFYMTHFLLSSSKYIQLV